MHPILHNIYCTCKYIVAYAVLNSIGKTPSTSSFGGPHPRHVTGGGASEGELGELWGVESRTRRTPAPGARQFTGSAVDAVLTTASRENVRVTPATRQCGICDALRPVY